MKPKGKGKGSNAEEPRAAQIAPGRGYFYAGLALSTLISLATYLRTVAASASFWDSGEFIATSYTLGIPHSPGTPLYVILGRVFSLLPLPMSIATKVNLISVVCGALGAGIVYLLVVKFLDGILGRSQSLADTLIKTAAGLVGAFFITFSDTYWINATEAEVYALSCFLMGFMTWLGLKWEENPMGVRATPLIFLLFYLGALSVGFHLGTILALGGVFLSILMTRKKTISDFEFLLACLGIFIFIADATLYRNGNRTLMLLVLYTAFTIWLWLAKRKPFPLICTALFALGLSVHLFLIIRSGHNPAIDEGDPETWRALYAALRREQYPPTNVFVRKASFAFQLSHFNGYFQNQFAMFSSFLGMLNLGSLLPIALGLWGMVDQLAKNKKNFIMLFTTFLITSLGLIIFLNFSDHEVRERDYFYSPAFYYFAMYIGLGAGSILSEVKNHLRARCTNPTYLTGLVAALLLASPFAVAAHNFFSHDRSRNYVCRDYAVNMLIGLEKDAIIFTNGDNDTFPLWYIQEVEHYRTDVRVVNLSLLNTPWYIKQLRDNEPKVPINWSDEQVDKLHPILTSDGWLLVRDLGIRHILKENRWQRPIYFAVTIPGDVFAPYRDYLEMEGLAFHLVPKKGKNMVNLAKLEDNLYRKFSFRSILTEEWKRDETIYLPSFTRKLIQNYAAAFCQLAFLKYQGGKKAEAVRALEIAQEIAPDIEPVVSMLGYYYLEVGDTGKALAHYQRQVTRHPDRSDLYYRLAGVYETMGKYDMALSLIDQVISRFGADRDLVWSAFSLALKIGQPGRARAYLNSWLESHPDDQRIKQALDQLDQATGKARAQSDGEKQ